MELSGIESLAKELLEDAGQGGKGAGAISGIWLETGGAAAVGLMGRPGERESQEPGGNVIISAGN